jgi:hypothetical protein
VISLVQRGERLFIGISKASRQGEQAPRRVQAGGETPRRELPFYIDFKGGEIVTLMC